MSLSCLKTGWAPTSQDLGNIHLHLAALFVLGVSGAQGRRDKKGGAGRGTIVDGLSGARVAKKEHASVVCVSVLLLITRA